MKQEVLSNGCVIVGGSIAGLVTARVLSAHFDEVIVLERDVLPGHPRHRKGVAQSHQVHVLLRRGYLGLETLFPGFGEALLAQGAQRSNASRDWWALFQGGLFPKFSSDLDFPCASRPLVEQVLRSLLGQVENVRIRDRTSVRHIGLSPAHGPVLEIEDSEGACSRLTPALCVDASGMGSRAHEWLAEAGFGRARVWRTRPRVGYATCRIRNPKLPEGCHATLIQHKAPGWTAGGGIQPIEGGEHLVTLTGFNGAYPPNDQADFIAYAQRLRSDVVYQAIREADFIPPIKSFRKDSNGFRRYAALKSWPRGFLVVGDALMSLNPVYGQGMSAAVLAAEVIGAHAVGLRESGDTRSIQRKISRRLFGPWLLAWLEDMRWAKTGPLTRWLLWIPFTYVDRVLMIASRDAEVCYRFLSVMHLTRSPVCLMGPSVMFKVLVSLFSRGKGRARRTSPANR